MNVKPTAIDIVNLYMRVQKLHGEANWMEKIIKNITRVADYRETIHSSQDIQNVGNR